MFTSGGVDRWAELPDEGLDHGDESPDVPGRMDHQEALQVLLQPGHHDSIACLSQDCSVRTPTDRLLLPT